MAWVLLVIIIVDGVVLLVVLRSMVGSPSSEKWFEMVYVSVLLIILSAAEPSVVGVSEPEPESEGFGWMKGRGGSSTTGCLTVVGGGGGERTLRAPCISSSVISWNPENTIFHSSCSRREGGGDGMGFLEVDDGWLEEEGSCRVVGGGERVG